MGVLEKIPGVRLALLLEFGSLVFLSGQICSTGLGDLSMCYFICSSPVCDPQPELPVYPQ